MYIGALVKYGISMYIKIIANIPRDIYFATTRVGWFIVISFAKYIAIPKTKTSQIKES